MFMTCRVALLVAVFVLGMGSAVAEVETETSLNEQTTAGWEVSATDLINVGSPSLSSVSGEGEGMRAAITDGKAGGALTADSVSAEYMNYDNNEYSMTYALNTESHPNGYDIQEIATYAGWSQWRVNQVYKVFVRTLTAERELVASVNYTPVIGGIPKFADASTRVLIKNNDGSPVASGVTEITFAFAADLENPQEDGKPVGAMYREVDVLGGPTP